MQTAIDIPTTTSSAARLIGRGDLVQVLGTGTFAAGKQGTVVTLFGPDDFGVRFTDYDPPQGFRFQASEVRKLQPGRLH